MKAFMDPIQINNTLINNRIVLPPMATSKTEDGKVNQAIIDYYKEKSKDGAIGLIITEHAYIRKDGRANFGQMSIAEDSDIEGLNRLVDVIHPTGSKVIAQINHAGSSAHPDVIGTQPISASAVINTGVTAKGDILPKEMTREDIQEIINDFATAAKRAEKSGFDGVEIHSAHGYLLNQFYSPLTNKRTDAYGGELSGRIKIHLEVIQAIKKVVSENFIIALRLGRCDYDRDGGNTFEDALLASSLFEKAGVHLLDISGGLSGYIRKDYTDAGYFADVTEALKKEVTIPVILTGGITQPHEMEALLQTGKADLIGVGRALLKDSDWAVKAIQSSK